MRFLESPLLLSALLTLALPAFAAPQPAWAADLDCDGVDDAADNCPDRFNPLQEDADSDLAGDKCDPDKDGDGIDNEFDTCPGDANPEQSDADGDGVGDACDRCAEVPNAVVSRTGCSIDQLCPCDGPEDGLQWRSHMQYLRCVKRKARNFAIRDLITSDERREIVVAAAESTCGTPTPADGDNDGDGVADAGDNCPSDSNPSQRNTDGDEFGDACDTDKDNDSVLNAGDNCPLVVNGGGQADDADADGVGDACDTCAETEAEAHVDRDGCSLDQHCPCAADEDGNAWGSRTRYRRCYYDEVFRFRLSGIITKEEADVLKSEAGASSCGERPPVRE